MRVLISAVLVFLLPGAALAFWRTVVVLVRSDVVIVLAVGVVAGLCLDRFVLRRWPRFHTFEHELTHALAAIVLFRRVESFVVRADGGYVRHRGGFGGRYGDDFIGLAPYVLPTFTMLSVLIRPFLSAVWFPWFDLWIGCTFGYHLQSTYRETRSGWTSRRFQMAGTSEWTVSDIARRGWVYSGLFILTVTLVIHGFMFAVLAGGYRAVWPWSRTVVEGSQSCVLALVHRVAELAQRS